MSDIETIRLRHRDDNGYCIRDQRDRWPCDTARVLVALDAAEADSRRLANYLEMALGEAHGTGGVSDHWRANPGGPMSAQPITDCADGLCFDGLGALKLHRERVGGERTS